LGLLVLGEQLTAAAGVGMLLLFAALSYLALSRNRPRRQNLPT
jgi:hypothetical protein